MVWICWWQPVKQVVRLNAIFLMCSPFPHSRYPPHLLPPRSVHCHWFYIDRWRQWRLRDITGSHQLLRELKFYHCHRTSIFLDNREYGNSRLLRGGVYAFTHKDPTFNSSHDSQNLLWLSKDVKTVLNTLESSRFTRIGLALCLSFIESGFDYVPELPIKRKSRTPNFSFAFKNKTKPRTKKNNLCSIFVCP